MKFQQLLIALGIIFIFHTLSTKLVARESTECSNASVPHFGDYPSDLEIVNHFKKHGCRSFTKLNIPIDINRPMQFSGDILFSGYYWFGENDEFRLNYAGNTFVIVKPKAPSQEQEVTFGNDADFSYISRITSVKGGTPLTIGVHHVKAAAYSPVQFHPNQSIFFLVMQPGYFRIQGQPIKLYGGSMFTPGSKFDTTNLGQPAVLKTNTGTELNCEMGTHISFSLYELLSKEACPPL